MIWLGLFGLGIGFGVVVTSHGFRWWLAPLISGLMFAGSMEFILVGMLAVGAPIAAITLTTFLINSRHLFYGLSFPRTGSTAALPRPKASSPCAMRLTLWPPAKTRNADHHGPIWSPIPKPADT